MYNQRKVVFLNTNIPWLRSFLRFFCWMFSKTLVNGCLLFNTKTWIWVTLILFSEWNNLSIRMLSMKINYLTTLHYTIYISFRSLSMALILRHKVMLERCKVAYFHGYPFHTNITNWVDIGSLYSWKIFWDFYHPMKIRKTVYFKNIILIKNR
jgi:hypothetical protein